MTDLLIDRDDRGSSLTALVILVPDHPHVAALTPARAPGVPDDPVVNVVLAAVANADDSVVEVRGLAVGLVIDTAGVHVEAPVGGIDADGSWAEVADLLLEIVLIALRNMDVALDGLDTLGRVPVARALDLLVRVVVVEHELAALLLDNVVVGTVRPATAAAEASVNAVDDVGLRENLESAGRDSPLGLLSTDDRESPARAAQALVLDAVDNILVPPVDRSWGSGGRLLGVLGGAAGRLRAKHRAVLGRSEAGELVEGNLEGLAVLVEVSNAAGVGKEDAEAEVVLVAGVGEVVLPHERNEGTLFVRHDDRAGGECEKRKHVM